MEHRADLVAVGEPARDLERALFVMLEPHPHRSTPARAQPAIVGRGDLANVDAGLAHLRDMDRPGGDRAHPSLRTADDLFVTGADCSIAPGGARGRGWNRV